MGMQEESSDSVAARVGDGVALALQGGGAHGAYAWGVLDRLLEQGLRIDRISGVSSGALIGVMLAQGMAHGGADGARAEMRRLWQRVGEVHRFSPFRASPLERWLWGWDIGSSLAWHGWETALRLFTPALLNPFGHNPLRSLIADLLDVAALADPRAPRLTIAATDVETGRAELFGNREITVDTLLASTCLPFVFPAVRIGGRAYWDGGYAGNPPLAPLIDAPLPRELVLIRAQPARRAGVPTTPTEIINRLNEIACHNVLEAELAALPASIRVRSFAADAALTELPIASRFTAEHAFLGELFAAGRAAAAGGG